MSKPLLLFRGPIKSISGYGKHSRELLEALFLMNKYEIKIDSCNWGSTPMTALDSNNLFHRWIESNIVTTILEIPDIYIQVTIPTEFNPIGKYNIGITAGIETTVAPKSWIDGCNRMDLVITTSKFSKDVLISTLYDEYDNNVLIKHHKVEKPIEILFEGVDTNIFNNTFNNLELSLDNPFNFLFVGHWLDGNIGQDRKDVSMLIKCFIEAFKNYEIKPALILKTSSATFSVLERERIIKRIKNLVGDNSSNIYLLFGELSDKEMNDLYNHPNVKTMVSITKGEGFGKPLLEFSMSGKPIIASNWSGHKDFLPLEKAILLGGKLTEVDKSVINDYIIEGSKWFTANYDEVISTLQYVYENYQTFLENAESLRIENSEKFSLIKMKEEFSTILDNYTNKPKIHKLNLPKITKIE